MPVPSHSSPADRVRRARAAILALGVTAAALAPVVPGLTRAIDGAAPEHLVVSEVATGGASASDEFIELYNPTGAALPLEGLELIYVTASGATISRRAAWALDTPSVPAGGHVLVANETGIYAPIADALYASGMAATGGSVAIRIQGAGAAIDAVGWGSAASAWLEGTPVSAPPAGASIERLPGGAAGSGQDTGDNSADFAERAAPEPQNLLSTPTPAPGASPPPTAVPSAGASSTPAPTASSSVPASPTPAPTSAVTPATALPVAEARAAVDGSVVTVEGVALTGSTFHDGGGFVADATGGIAVLPDEGTFEAGQLLRVTGEVDDRFSQRTLRPAAGGIVALGTGGDPDAVVAGSGSIGEGVEGRLVRIKGTIAGSPTELTAALAFDLDDGSGTTRVLVGTLTGIVTDEWVPGAMVELVGVAGQRDSTGSGAEGYRVMPRSPTDVVSVTAPAAPTPGPSSAGPSPSATEGPGGDEVITIAQARAAGANARVRVRGVVTLPSGLVDDRTAVIQDATGAILLRLGGDVGRLSLGSEIEVGGMRSTLAGMESVRVNQDPTHLGASGGPSAIALSTGAAAESREAQLVVARGSVVASARRSSSGSVSFEIDDGSGPLRVSAAPAARVDRGPIVAGTWVEVRGVLGQETTRAEPTEGYRIWPRDASDIRVVAPATDAGGGSQAAGTGSGPRGGGAATLAGVDSAGLSSMRIGATLVVGRWDELGVAGLLWDGSRLVAIHPSSAAVVDRVTRQERAPLALELASLTAAGTDPGTGATRVRLGSSASETQVLDAAPARPAGDLDGPLPAWASLTGRLDGAASQLRLGAVEVSLQLRCESDRSTSRARLGGRAANVTGVALGDPPRLIVPCGGMRPAPALAGLATGAMGRDRVAASTSRPAVAVLAGESDPRRSFAAAALLAGAVALAGAAWLRRVRGAGPADEPSDAVDGGSAEGRHLTLVRVRNRHGP